MIRNLAIGGAAGAGVVGAIYYANQQPQIKPASSDKSRPPPMPKVDLPDHVQYLLLGGGTASFGAYRAIRSADPKAQVLVVGHEQHMPYMKPPLSKELWQEPKLNDSLTFTQWNGKERSIMFEHPDFFKKVDDIREPGKGGVAYVGGVKAVKIDPTKQIVYFTDGSKIEYDRCLLSTGSLLKDHVVLSRVPGIEKFVVELKTIEDFKTIQKTALNGGCIAVLGGGSTASELSANMVEFGKRHAALTHKSDDKQLSKSLGTPISPELRVIQIFPEEGNMRSLLPAYLAKWLTRQMTSEGVDVRPNSDVIGAEVINDGKQLRLKLTSGESVVVDRVVMANGHSEPDVRLARESGLEVDPVNGGIVVNAEMEARKNLYVAGDACSFFDACLGRRRFQSHDHAIMTGRVAGKNMAGERREYGKQAMMWSDVGELTSFEGVGILDPSLKTYSVFFPENPEKKPDFNGKLSKGVVFYMNPKNVVVGVLLCNIFGRISDARKVISEQKSLDLKDVAKIFYEKPIAAPEAEGEKAKK